jgi:quercetin dioxygenase-like cupin family protein
MFMASQASAYPDLVVVKNGEVQESTPEPGLLRKVMAYNDKLFLAEHKMARGWSGAVHSHPHDQIVYIVRGHLKVSCQGKTFDARAGDTFVVRGGVEHGASAVEDSVVVDVFTPCWEDYIA